MGAGTVAQVADTAHTINRGRVRITAEPLCSAIPPKEQPYDAVPPMLHLDERQRGLHVVLMREDVLHWAVSARASSAHGSQFMD